MHVVEELEEIVLDRYTQFKANFPPILAPRWSDDTLLIQANVKEHNKLRCIYERGDGKLMFPEPLYISGKEARRFKSFEMPTRDGRIIKMRAIPVKAFKRLRLSQGSRYL